jgi:Bacterial Ig-like domain (group 3)
MRTMSFLLSPKWFALKSRRSAHTPRVKDYRRKRVTLIVTPLEERQLLTIPTLTSVSASASNLTFGQAEVFTATVVTNPPSANIPTGGTVTFDNGTTTLGTAPLVNGSASLTTVLAAGTYSVTASYDGTSTSFASSMSSTSAGYIFNQAGNGTFGNTVTAVAGQPATAAELANPFGVAVGPTGTIYVADTFNNEIDFVNPNTGLIQVLAGNGTAGDADGPALSAEFQSPRGLALDAPLNLLFIADRDNNVIRELNLATGMVSTVAGTGTFGAGGTGIPATTAALANPTAVAVNSSGLDVFIADTFNNVVRELNLTTNMITTVAGTGTAGFSGDNGPATSAELFDPSGLAVSPAGTLYISDSDNEVVRAVNASTQVITTIAGTPQTSGFTGDNGLATSATLATPWGLALNSAGTTLYIADRDNNAIREVNLTTGIITTFAGSGPFGSTGDNGPATAATLSSPRSVALDSAGNLLIADTLGNQIRLVGGGMGTASVTVVPFVSVPAGNLSVFSGNVPTGMCRRTAQAIVISLANTADATAASLVSNFRLTTLPNAHGRVTNLGIRRVSYDASSHVLTLFTRTRLKPTGTYQLIIRGQPVGPVTVVFNRPSIISESV